MNVKKTMNRRILLINGSIHGTKGETHLYMEKLREGMERAGADVEVIALAEKNIVRCRGCFCCWRENTKKCPLNDDVPGILDRMTESDLVIFAVPLYVNNISSQMQIFMERTLPLCKIDFEKGRSGVYQHKQARKVPPLIFFGSCNLPEPSHLDIISLYADRVADAWHTEIVGKILRTEALLITTCPKCAEILFNDYLRRLALAGEEITETGRLSEFTQKRLNRVLIDKEIVTTTGLNYFLKD